MAELTEQEKRQGILTVRLTDGVYKVGVSDEGYLQIEDKLSEAASSVSGGQRKLWVNSDEASQLLTEVLKELKILNLHMTVMTDNDFKRTEVEV